MTGTFYSGWLILDRPGLLAALAAQGVHPVHAHVDTDHVTYAYPDATLPPAISRVLVTGVAADERVQALTVEVVGRSTRPDGRTYHITYSLRPDARPEWSNDLLAAVPATLLPRPITLDVAPFLRPPQP